MIAGSVVLLFVFANRFLFVLLPVVTGVAVFLFSGYLREFMSPGPESVYSAKSRRKRLTGGLIWSFVVGVAFGRYVSVTKAVSSASWSFLIGFLIGFGGAMFISVLWALAPYRLLADTALIFTPDESERTGSIYAEEERETENELEQ